MPDPPVTVPPQDGGRPRLLILSSSLLTDRMLTHTTCLENLSSESRVRIWATSTTDTATQSAWGATPFSVEELPEVKAFREFPHNYLRRLNEFAWDFSRPQPSRLSIARHIRDKSQRSRVKALKKPGRVIALLRQEQRFEALLERLLLSCRRSPAAVERLKIDRPDVLVATGPFWFWEPAVMAEARKLSIPLLALIPSWDNLSTKGRMPIAPDGFMVWSEAQREQLHYFYPSSRNKPAYVIGAPQFDVFFHERFRLSRQEFCRRERLDPDRPIIVHALGSPNLIREHHAATFMAGRVADGDLNGAQLLVRPHPIHDYQELADIIEPYGPDVVLQRTAQAGTPLIARSQDREDVLQWVNTFRHADVVINLSSTVTIDAVLFDKPVVNLDFDPQPGAPKQSLVEDINHVWTHFKPVAESGGVWLVRTPDEMVEAVRAYLARPDLHRDGRKWIAEYVCSHTDGRCGSRMAEAILDFAGVRMQSAAEVS